MRKRILLLSSIPLVVLILVLAYAVVDWNPGDLVTDYQAPRSKPDEELVDDLLDEKNPAFLAELVDRRPEGGWRINASAAVLRLDIPMLKPDSDAALLELRPFYADAMAHAPSSIEVLPSINVIDGKAKQFDDGLFAAIDLACYQGLKPKPESVVTLIKRMYERVAPESPAAAYLAAGLRIAGVDVKTSRPDQATSWLNRFDSSVIDSKPLGFYTWSSELTQVFRFMRFFQQPLPRDKPDLIMDLAKAVRSDVALLDEYKRVNGFQARLTNPVANRTLADVLANGDATGDSRPVAVFPSSRSKETELFRRLFPNGLPPGTDLMREMIRAIRQGRVDLTPGPGSGWYEYQIHALETFLLPEKGAENPKLLLTIAYKKRMLEAFTALITKRRETHASNLEGAKSAMAFEPPPRAKVKPRLRVEPCPSYYLRSARAYDFLLTFLVGAVGEVGLASLHGLKEGGQRSKPLLEELRWMRSLYYGLYLLSAEDIGMAPSLRPDEPVDRPACEATAKEWLGSYRDDPDLKVDTRAAVPIYFDIGRRRTRLWATIGVRLAKLDVSYVRPPRVKLADSSGEWTEAEPDQLQPARYVIAVDEFAEVEVPGLQPLTRREFRDLCDSGRASRSEYGR